MHRYTFVLLLLLNAVHAVSFEPAKVELISESAQVSPGEVFNLALDFQLEPHWHVYWKNPGASGFPVEVDWKLPKGFKAGEIQWPAPERIELGGLVSYGFEDAVTFIVPVQAPEVLESGMPLKIEAEASWLICKEICLPGSASLSLELTSGLESVSSVDKPSFDAARARLPGSLAPWSISAVVEEKALVLSIEQSGEVSLPSELYFYADAEGVIDPSAEQVLSVVGDKQALLKAPLAVEQLGQPMQSYSGVLQSSLGSWQVEGFVGLEKAVKPELSPVVDTDGSKGFEGFLLSVGLPGWLLLAFVGGLILNLMPCVLPVLSLKVFSLLKHSGQSRAQVWLHGGVYSLGVVASFLALGGLLLGLRTLGEQVGWGFQLQSPGFVTVLTVALFLFALNLLGVFEVGIGLIGADTKISKRNDILGSFGMGVLAAVVGAPCIGPFLAPVSGVALQTDALSGLLIFGFMGLGLAAPFLLLAGFPKMLDCLPKPGAWMETLKHVMGFLLMATVVFLLSVAGTLAGEAAILALLIALLLTAVAAWIYGRWAVLSRPKSIQRIAQVLSLLLLLVAVVFAISRSRQAYQSLITDSSVVDVASGEAWAPWSVQAVEEALDEGRPVFVDFTASWCLICQVNKKVALRTEATRLLFEEYNVVTLEADWTRRDTEITKELERFGRSGVPLYVLHAPNGEVVTLSQNLTNKKVREAVEKLLN